MVGGVECSLLEWNVRWRGEGRVWQGRWVAGKVGEMIKASQIVSDMDDFDNANEPPIMI